jgi:hypothetical protein
MILQEEKVLEEDEGKGWRKILRRWGKIRTEEMWRKVRV